MTASRNRLPADRRAGACLFALGLALAAPATAWSQNAPQSLLPSGPAPANLTPSMSPLAAPPPVPSPAAPAQDDNSSSIQSAPIPNLPPVAPPDSGPPSDAVQVQGLAAFDADTLGTLTPGAGGLLPQGWTGTPYALVAGLMPNLPDIASSPSLRGLLRRLALSAMAAPADKPTGASLIELRAARLWAIGDVDGLAALLKLVPTPSVTAPMRRFLADAALLGGDDGAACALQPALAADLPSDPYPSELAIYCQLTAGQVDQAGLALDVLRDQKLDDRAFFALADRLSGNGGDNLDALLTGPTPLIVAMANHGHVALPAPAATLTQPAILRAIALSADATPAARLAASERAFSAGAIGPDILARVYQSAVFTPAELSAGQATLPGAKQGARGRALMFQIAAGEAAPAAQADIIGHALGLAPDGGGFVQQAILYSGPISAIPPTPDLGWFAPQAIRALLVAGSAEAARSWVDMLRNGGDPQSAARLAGLWPLLRIAGIDQSPPPFDDAMKAWGDALAGVPPPAAERRREVAMSLMTAFGDTLPAAAWVQLYDGPMPVTPTRPALLQGLRLAEQGNRAAETVLLGIATIGQADLATVDATGLYQVTEAFAHVGLSADARAFATEAAIANGL